MLTPQQCRQLDPTLESRTDEEVAALLTELYSYADFFLDRWERAHHGIPSISRKDIEAEIERRV